MGFDDVFQVDLFDWILTKIRNVKNDQILLKLYPVIIELLEESPNKLQYNTNFLLLSNPNRLQFTKFLTLTLGLKSPQNPKSNQRPYPLDPLGMNFILRPKFILNSLGPREIHSIENINRLGVNSLAMSEILAHKIQKTLSVPSGRLNPQIERILKKILIIGPHVKNNRNYSMGIKSSSGHKNVL